MRLTSLRAYTRPAPVPKMPPGLVELMEGLTKEVLRHNPPDVYGFCTNHMEKLLETRDGSPRVKPLTLEQKIANAQKKVRQRAKERQERFDEEFKSQSSKDCEDAAAEQIPDTNIALDDPIIHSLKAPIHHEHDLEHASEIEISHVEQADQNNCSETMDLTATEEPLNEHDVTESLVDVKEASVENVAIDDKTNPIIEKGLEYPHIEILKEHETNEEFTKKDPAESQNESTVVTLNENSLCGIIANMNSTQVNENEVSVSENIDKDFVEKTQLDKTSEVKDKTQIVELNEPEDIKIQNQSADIFAKTKSNQIDVIVFDESMNQVSTTESGDKIMFCSVNEKENSSDELKSKEQLNEDYDGANTSFEVAVNTRPISTNEPAEIDNYQISIQKDIISDETLNNISNPDIASIPTPLMDNKDELPESNVNNHHEQIYNDSDGHEKQNEETKNTFKDRNISEIEKETIDNASASGLVASTELTEEAKIDERYVVDNADLKNIKIEDRKSVTNENELHENQVRMESKQFLILNPTDENLNSSDISLLSKSDSTGNTVEDIISTYVEADESKTDDSTSNNPNNMDLETAAITIQKVFRSFMFKSRNSTFEDVTHEHNSLDEDSEKKEEYYTAANMSKERRTLGITRMDTVLQTVNEEKSLSLSTDDSSTLSSAATTIQAHVRGFLVRSRLNSNKTVSMNSLVNSHEVLETDSEQQNNKTILNIHIVPEEGNYLSRDESFITSMELSLDSSPPSSINLHPLSNELSERRKMLKREDAIQSVSPPSNNSGKLSEESVKEVLVNESDNMLVREPNDDQIKNDEDHHLNDLDNTSDLISDSCSTPITVIDEFKIEEPVISPNEPMEAAAETNGAVLTKMCSDEADVITPYVPSPRSSENCSKLMHSGEFHDVVLPTKVSRSDTSVVREFKNVLVYFLLWNNSIL